MDFRVVALFLDRAVEDEDIGFAVDAQPVIGDDERVAGALPSSSMISNATVFWPSIR